MRKTRNMIYKPSIESRELKLYVDNNPKVYKELSAAHENLLKKVNKGIYESEKARMLFYRIATVASVLYNKNFGYSFSVTVRYTVAAELEQDFKIDNMLL